MCSRPNPPVVLKVPEMGVVHVHQWTLTLKGLVIRFLNYTRLSFAICNFCLLVFHNIYDIKFFQMTKEPTTFLKDFLNDPLIATQDYNLCVI